MNISELKYCPICKNQKHVSTGPSYAVPCFCHIARFIESDVKSGRDEHNFHSFLSKISPKQFEQLIPIRPSHTVYPCIDRVNRRMFDAYKVDGGDNGLFDRFKMIRESGEVRVETFNFQWLGNILIHMTRLLGVHMDDLVPRISEAVDSTDFAEKNSVLPVLTKI